MKYKLIIFDFDGTLANTFPWMLRIAARVAEKYHYSLPDQSQIEIFRGYDARKLMRIYKVSIWKLFRMARDVNTWMSKDIHQISLFGGVDRLLRCLREQGIQLALVSSNTLENVRNVLGPDLFDCFQYFECGVTVFGKSRKFKKILRKSGMRPAESICIGDEIRDVQAARKAQIPFGAVTWGYTRGDALRALEPHELFTSVDEMAEKVALTPGC